MHPQILLLLATTLTFFASLTAGSPAQNSKRALKYGYGSTPVRGVNLGGWFVLEPWITPSIFAPFQDTLSTPSPVVDEYTLTAALGPDEALNRLQAHWDSWITREDFQAIKNVGLNHVRIPIGYWSIIPIYGEPFVQGAYERLGRAIVWAEEVGLGVMIDLHGAPGSQNGFDNSGRYGAIRWGTAPGTISHTLSVLAKLRDDWAAHPAVMAIQLVNEPANWGVPIATIRDFYNQAWDLLKDSAVAIVFHDAFTGVTSWGDWGTDKWNLVLDTHHYEVFDNGQLALDLNGHLQSVCAFGRQMAGTGKVTISGEWTGAMTDCAKWLNGFGKGARYDGTFNGAPYVGSCAGKSEGPVSGLDTVATAKFIEAQLDAYELAGGWIFWTWKTEGAPEWDMKALLAQGVFPSPVTARKYPGQCGY